MQATRSWRTTNIAPRRPSGSWRQNWEQQRRWGRCFFTQLVSVPDPNQPCTEWDLEVRPSFRQVSILKDHWQCTCCFVGEVLSEDHWSPPTLQVSSLLTMSPILSCMVTGTSSKATYLHMSPFFLCMHTHTHTHTHRNVVLFARRWASCGETTRH